jgi:hypothetical protein
MPVTSSIFTTSIQSQLLAHNIRGRDFSKLAQAVGSALGTFFSTPNLVTCYLSGLAGPQGSVIGFFPQGVNASSMLTFMDKKHSPSLHGRDISTIFSCFANGVSLVENTMILSGTVIGCATGTGTGKFFGITYSTLTALTTPYILQLSIKGRDMLSFVDAICFGIVMHLLTSVTFTVTSVGVPAPTPPTGPVSVFNIPSVTTQIK